jgi:ribose 5-phosphate isomerase A
MKILSSKFGGKPKLRMAVNKAGPVITDNGFFILDVDFGLIENPTELNFQLKQLPGVLETGLFINMVDKVFFGQPDGSIITIDKNRKTTIIKK